MVPKKKKKLKTYNNSHEYLTPKIHCIFPSLSATNSS